MTPAPDHLRVVERTHHLVACHPMVGMPYERYGEEHRTAHEEFARQFLNGGGVTVPDAAVPWVLAGGCVVAGAVGGTLAAIADRYFEYFNAWIAGHLSGLPVLVAPYGCDDCPAGVDQPHRYAGCPGNVRQHERGLSR